MAVAWFFAPYKRRDFGTLRTRYCSMDDFTVQIKADGGNWSESECLGNHAIVKVRANQATLDTINATPGMLRIPLALLDDQLSSLSAVQRTAIRTRLEALGYTLAEIQAAIPDLANATLRDVLRFALTRRLKPRYDSGTDSIVLDGPPQPTRALEHADGDV